MWNFWKGCNGSTISLTHNRIKQHSSHAFKHIQADVTFRNNDLEALKQKQNNKLRHVRRTKHSSDSCKVGKEHRVASILTRICDLSSWFLWLPKWQIAAPVYSSFFNLLQFYVNYSCEECVQSFVFSPDILLHCLMTASLIDELTYSSRPHFILYM